MFHNYIQVNRSSDSLYTDIFVFLTAGRSTSQVQ